MATETTERPVRLRYVPEHRVLLCTSCRYCVLPRALERHLKYLHLLPAAKRARELRCIKHLDLAETKTDVSLPSPESPPIRGLPVSNGYACNVTECSHLCATLKRMQTHWREVHRSLYFSKNHCSLFARPVKVQTFFKGHNTHYFIVSSQRALHFAEQNEPSLLRNPSCHNAEETSTDWLLTQEFHDRTYQSLLPVAGADKSWRSQMLAVCDQADYLRFAVLSITATHVAYAQPESCQLYGQEADRLRNLAIQKLSSALRRDEPEGFFALFNFTRLMTTCSLARSQFGKIEGDQQAIGDQVLPEWVKVQRQGRALVWPQSGRGRGKVVGALRGPAQPLSNVERLTGAESPTECFEKNPDDKQLARLQLELQTLPNAQVSPECVEALRMLRRVWAIPFQESVMSFRDAALMWTARVSAAYLNLIEGHDPIALVIFAHYCVLWSYSEDWYWYMKGHAETMLSGIMRCLDRQELIAWPVSKILGGAVGDLSV